MSRKLINQFSSIFVVVLLISFSFFIDQRVQNFVLQINHDRWMNSGIVLNISRYGDWPVFFLIGIFGYLISLLRKKIVFQYLFLSAIYSSSLAGIVANIFRFTTGRTRPIAPLYSGWYGPIYNGHLIIGQFNLNSFPSAHTATACGFLFIFLIYTKSYWKIVLVIPALSIATSRILLGAHHFSDVMTSIVIAYFVSLFVWENIRQKGKLDRFTSVKCA